MLKEGKIWADWQTQIKIHLLHFIVWKKKKIFLKSSIIEVYQQNTDVIDTEILAHRGLSLWDGMVWQLQETLSSIFKGTWKLESKMTSCVLVSWTVSCVLIIKLWLLYSQIQLPLNCIIMKQLINFWAARAHSDTLSWSPSHPPYCLVLCLKCPILSFHTKPTILLHSNNAVFWRDYKTNLCWKIFFKTSSSWCD